jgi:hypothetical protein
MADLLPWVLLFFFLCFCGIFFWFLLSVRSQDRALYAILQQQKTIRLEVDRLAKLLAGRAPADEADGGDGASKRDVNASPAVSPEALVPGIDRLLLGSRPPEPIGPASARKAAGLPDLKL